MRASLMLEVVDKKTGEVKYQASQPSRSFTEGFMSVLYAAFSRLLVTQYEKMGYTPLGHSTIMQENSASTGETSMFLKVSGSDPNNPISLYHRHVGHTSWSLLYAPPMMGVFFGEGDTAVSSYDRHLELPLGVRKIVTIARCTFEHARMSTTGSLTFDGTRYWSISRRVSPHEIVRHNNMGVEETFITTDRTGTTTSQNYNDCFAEPGHLVTVTLGNMLYRIDYVTGFTVLSRSIAADGFGGAIYALAHDDVAGNIIGLSSAGNLMRWSLVDFTVVAGPTLIDFTNTISRVPLTLYGMVPIDSGVNRYWLVGTSSRLYVLDTVLMVLSSYLEVRDMNITTTGGVMRDANYFYIPYNYGASNMRIGRFRLERRELEIRPTIVTPPTTTAVSGYFDITGEIANNSGVAVTVREIGMHCGGGAHIYPLISRDVIAVPIVLNSGEILRGTYRISATI